MGSVYQVKARQRAAGEVSHRGRNRGNALIAVAVRVGDRVAVAEPLANRASRITQLGSKVLIGELG